MRRLITLVVISVVAASCAQTVNIEQEKTALMARDNDWATTLPDLAKWGSYLAPDATFAMPGVPELKGQKNITDGLAPMTKAPGFKVTWKATSAEIGASGDVGYTSGTYELTMNNAAGHPAVEKGSYLTTWKRISGTWLATHDMSSPDAPANPSSPQVVTPAAAIKWMDAPPFLPKGAKLAVLVGDPGKPEPFTIRLQMPDGYKIAPHTHPTDEHVTVMSGTFRAAMGEKWDDKALGDFAPGSYANMAAGMAHYAAAKGATVVQVHGVGPFVVNYVNPADDPSKQK
jgi:ketosteroid isomerase-like protein/quercetin dioxygenase-like cupin family protein